MKKKYIVASVVAALLLGAYAMDSVRANSYEYELVDTSAETFVADGQSTVRITVKLSRRGQPVEGHTIYIYASNGTLPASRCVTDHDGLINFRYYPYVYLNDEVTPLENVTIYLQDESNSFIFMRPAEARFTFGVEKPETDNVWNDWQGLEDSNYDK